MSEFKAFGEIKQFGKALFVRITEKIHGSNAQILIENGVVTAGSRTRWLSPGKETDNYGFASWAADNSAELVEKLGEGRHYGEWYGAGINSGYNLKEKRLALFNTQGFAEKPLPPQVDVVPTLYEGPYSQEAVDQAAATLKEKGSQLVPGFMSPEGLVINFPAFGHSVKYVFKPEETAWRPLPGTRKERVQILVDEAEVTKRLQPIRLEKLFSRDSTYHDLPASLPRLAKDYIADLEKEGQLEGADPATIKAIKRALFPWIKEMISGQV